MPPYFIDSVRGVAVGDASHCFPMGKDGGKIVFAQKKFQRSVTNPLHRRIMGK